MERTSRHQPSAEAAATALQAVVRAVGGLPEELRFGGYGRPARLELQTRPRYSAGAGGDRQAAGSAATPATPAAVAEVTAQQVLERAAARMWDTAEAEAAAAMARAEAAEAAYVAENSWHRREELARMYILLRGPFVWQRTCGPDGAASGGGAARLKEWLESLVARSPPPATASVAGATPGIQARIAAEAPGEVKVRRCSFAACGSGSAMALAECGDPIAALQLYRAAVAAAAGEAPGCLQVSVCKAGAAWTVEISKVWTPIVFAQAVNSGCGVWDTGPAAGCAAVSSRMPLRTRLSPASTHLPSHPRACQPSVSDHISGPSSAAAPHIQLLTCCCCCCCCPAAGDPRAVGRPPPLRACAGYAHGYGGSSRAGAGGTRAA